MMAKEHIDFVINLIAQSTFVGAGAHKVASALDLLQAMSAQAAQAAQVNQELQVQEESNEKAES